MPPTELPPLGERWELRCVDVHPAGCEKVLSASSAGALVTLACEHGAGVHGFTPAFYSAQRLSSIAGAVKRRP